MATPPPPPPPSAGATNSPIHWQSAFWALASLALNTALQNPVGQISSPWSSTTYRFALRTSPFFCLFDTLTVVFQLGFQVIGQNRSRWRGGRIELREAVRSVAERRGLFDDDGDVDVENRRLTRDVSLSKRLTEWAVFVLALLQAVKLSGMKGIPWTQTWGAIYMASYVVGEMLNQFGRRRPSTSPATMNDLRREDGSKAGSDDPTAAAEAEEAAPENSNSVEIKEDGETSPPAAADVFLPASCQVFVWIWVGSHFSPQFDRTQPGGVHGYFSQATLAVAVLFWFCEIMVSDCMLGVIPFILCTLALVLLDLAVLVLPSASLLYLLYHYHHLVLKTKKGPLASALTALADIFDAEVSTVYSAIGAATASALIYAQLRLLGGGGAWHLTAS